MLGWLLLGGKCRRCRAPISKQYPLIELIVALLWGAAVWYYGLTWHALAGAVLGTLLLGIAVTDARHYIIPDAFTWGGLVLGLGLALPAGLAALGWAALGAAAGFALLYAVAWAGELALRKEAMGGGDIKMMAMVGAFLGWQGVLLTIFGGALLGTLIFVPISLRTRKLGPFGVFLAAGAAVAFVAAGLGAVDQPARQAAIPRPLPPHPAPAVHAPARRPRTGRGATGRDAATASIAVTTGLLAALNREELQGVVAHEMGHGLHAYLAREQGIFHQTTPLTLAETASVFGETVTFGRLLECEQKPREG